jgi:hypothetical protein
MTLRHAVRLQYSEHAMVTQAYRNAHGMRSRQSSWCMP